MKKETQTVSSPKRSKLAWPMMAVVFLTSLVTNIGALVGLRSGSADAEKSEKLAYESPDIQFFGSDLLNSAEAAPPVSGA